MSGSDPASPDPLRCFLRERMSPTRLRRAASADYDCDGDGICEEFKRNLDTGAFGYVGHGNPYECALMQRHDMTSDRPINELFGAWWIGTFCSNDRDFVLIDNLSSHGVDSLLHMVVRGCGELGDDARLAARAARPFIAWLSARTPGAEDASFSEALAALEAIERLGNDGTTAEAYRSFMHKIGE